MKQAEFDKYMKVWGSAFYEDTCIKLQAVMVRKIMNNGVMNDTEKMLMLKQYMSNLSTNDCVVEAIKQYNKR